MPFNRNKAKEFCRERANELRKLANLLEFQGIANDTGPLLAAAAQCQQSGLGYWKYDVSALVLSNIPQETCKNVCPPDSEITSIELSMELSGCYLEPYELADPFKGLAVDIFIRGEALVEVPITEESSELTSRNLACAWHLDRHIENDENDEIADAGDDKKEGVPAAAHPIYHFHSGGRKMWNLNGADYGKQLLLEAPRLAHPPLDAVLAIDFILSNYYGTKWIDLIDDNEYIQLIGPAQKRCWYAYAMSTASLWHKSTNEFNKVRNAIWPQLLFAT